MTDVDASFENAVSTVRSQTNDPGNDTKLRLYALYKQATVGNVEGKRPGFTNPVGRAKYDAWALLIGMSPTEAKHAYVAEAAKLVP